MQPDHTEQSKSNICAEALEVLKTQMMDVDKQFNIQSLPLRVLLRYEKQQVVLTTDHSFHL